MKLPGIFEFFGSPKKSVAAAVDMVVDRLNDKYELELRVVEGGLKVRITDVKPEDAPAKELK